MVNASLGRGTLTCSLPTKMSLGAHVDVVAVLWKAAASFTRIPFDMT